MLYTKMVLFFLTQEKEKRRGRNFYLDFKIIYLIYKFIILKGSLYIKLKYNFNYFFLYQVQNGEHTLRLKVYLLINKIQLQIICASGF